MLRSLRARLIIAFGGLTLVAIVAFALVLGSTLERLLLDTLAEDLHGQAAIIAKLVAEDVASDQHELVEAAIRSLETSISARPLVTDSHGHSIGSAELGVSGSQVPISVPPVGMRRALSGESNQGIYFRQSPDNEVLYVALPIEHQGEIVGAVRLAYQLKDIEDAIRQRYIAIGIGAAITVALTSLVAAGFASAITRPIRALSHAAERMASGDLDQHVTTRSSHEVGVLVDAFNDMSARLRELETARREFASDVSHELHSLAGAMQTAATALELGADQDPDLRRRLLDGLVSHTGRLGRLADDLLELARLDAGRLPLSLQAATLHEVASQVVAEWSAEAASRSVSLQLRVADDAPVMGDHQRLVQACGNLVENALKYTPDGGRVTLTVRSGRTTSVLEVRDNGQGIPREELPYIFHRFYRVEGRAGTGPGGTGLGLAIVDRIIQSHGGTIAVSSTVGGGSTFVIRLPLRETAESRAPVPERVGSQLRSHESSVRA